MGGGQVAPLHRPALSALLPRYSTIYTMFPVFSLVLDKDVKSEVAMLYPELYKDLLKVRGPWPPACPPVRLPPLRLPGSD